MRQLGCLLILLIAALLPAGAAAQVRATLLENRVNPNAIDEDNDWRPFADIGLRIKVEGGKGHKLQVEIPWTDNVGEPIYTDIDDLDQAVTTKEFEIPDDNYVISASNFGPYLDRFVLKPSDKEYRISGKIKLKDLTTGSEIDLENNQKLHFTTRSHKPATGIVVTNQYLEHNEYRNGAKGMYVNYKFETNWLKGKEIKYVVELFKKNGTPIGYIKGGTEKVTGIYTPTYTFTTFSDKWAHFPYSGMKLPKGRTECYAIIKFYDAKTGKPIPTQGNYKMDFYVTK